jgi:hypothetical protein
MFGVSLAILPDYFYWNYFLEGIIETKMAKD